MSSFSSPPSNRSASRCWCSASRSCARMVRLKFKRISSLTIKSQQILDYSPSSVALPLLPPHVVDPRRQSALGPLLFCQSDPLLFRRLDPRRHCPPHRSPTLWLVLFLFCLWLVIFYFVWSGLRKKIRDLGWCVFSFFFSCCGLVVVVVVVVVGGCS